MVISPKGMAIELSDDSIRAIAELVVELMSGQQAGTPKLWSADELAERYQCSASTIGQRIREGAFGEPVKVGRHLMVTAGGVRQFDSMMAARAARPAPRRRRQGIDYDPGPI